jgi:hypothetical protein
MSGLDAAAAIIGISDAGIRSIVGLCNFVKDLKDAPTQVQHIGSEAAALTQSLSGLSFLHQADEESRMEVKRIGLPGAVSNGGTACADLKKDLEKWTMSGPNTLYSRVNVRRHKRKIDAYMAKISVARDAVTLSVGVANLYVGGPDASNNKL